MFISYALLYGTTCSIVFLIYTRSSIALSFGAAAMFAVVSAYGSLACRSLNGWADFLFIGLWGVVLTNAANLFFHSDAMKCCDVVVFIGLTAYDT